jgi:hypothetical protein
MSVWEKLSLRFVNEVIPTQKELVLLDNWHDPPTQSHITSGWDFLPIVPMVATPVRDVCAFVQTEANLQVVLAGRSVFDMFRSNVTTPISGKILSCIFDVRLYRTLLLCVDNYTSDVAKVITFACCFGVDIRVLKSPHRLPPWGLNRDVDHKDLLRVAANRRTDEVGPGWFIEIGARNDGLGKTLEKRGWKGVMYDSKQIKLAHCTNRQCIKVHNFIADSAWKTKDNTLYECMSIRDAMKRASKPPSLLILNCKNSPFDTSMFRWVVMGDADESSLGSEFPSALDGSQA